ncbi:MAG: hypothetical protein DWQ07_12770 [Chloroflexi bacterium]|nr:MAG: hypothetical protein DWQ07_12770 [Chloroflexota bacterium]MBL1196912.1 hypothetical protein [Chloroflexota bacterium]NOH14208.1 hypothetical protein [Chloroflexota bacterium]
MANQPKLNKQDQASLKEIAEALDVSEEEVLEAMHVAVEALDEPFTDVLHVAVDALKEEDPAAAMPWAQPAAAEAEGEGPPVEDAEAAEAAQDGEKPYATLQYGGGELLRCEVCQFDTLEGEAVILDRMRKCQKENCPVPPVAPKPNIPTAHASGKEKK